MDYETSEVVDTSGEDGQTVHFVAADTVHDKMDRVLEEALDALLDPKGWHPLISENAQALLLLVQAYKILNP